MSEDLTSLLPLRKYVDGTWPDIPVLEYKNDPGVPFKDITRQILFHSPDLSCELRYFEISVGGYSTLERHAHVHGVLIFKGEGECLLGDKIFALSLHDLVYIPPMTWHQFRANRGKPLGFLCLVNKERDKPQLPEEDQREILKTSPEIEDFLGE